MKVDFNRGNFLSFIFIQHSHLKKLKESFFEQFKTELENHQEELVNLLHISLTRTFNLVKPQIKPFLEKLSKSNFLCL